jgi:hypothetical protein
MFGFLISSEHQLYNVTPLKTPFGLVIPLLQSQSHVTTITHNYFLGCYAFTQLQIYMFVIKSLIPLLHWLTSQLSITVSNYHRLYIFTCWNSRRELTPRIHFLRLLLNNSLVGLLLTDSSTDCLLRHFKSSYKPSMVRAHCCRLPGPSRSS